MTLSVLLREYRGHLNADFARYYGELPRRLMTHRGYSLTEVADLTGHLPRESATMLAAVPKGELELWDVDTYLLALIADHLAGANYQRSGKGPKPKPVKRPKANTKRAEVPTLDELDELKAWYAAQPGGRDLTL